MELRFLSFCFLSLKQHKDILKNFQQKTDVRLQELLSEGDYPAAIQLLLEVQQAVKTYNHFVAIKQLALKLQDTLELTEEQLDVALAKANSFNKLNIYIL